MADIAAGDVTVTIMKNRILRGSPGGIRLNTVKIVFGDGALTYDTTAHIPLPAAAKFGMLQSVEDLIILQNGLATIKYVWTYDRDHHALVGVEEVAAASSTALAEIADTTAIAAQTLYALAIGW